MQTITSTTLQPIPIMRWFVLLAASLIVAVTPLSADILVKSGETVAFLGDSITEQGAASPGGHVRLVATGLKANGVDIQSIPAGVSGHKSNQMLQRLPGILAKKPDWLTLSCGVNDVWHQSRGTGVSLEDYRANITAIVDQCRDAGVKVVILTATQINLPVTNAANTKLADYNAFLRELARERGLPLADLNAGMLAEQRRLETAGIKRVLTTDGVHMNIHGNLMMARGVLAAFGLDNRQLATADKAWLDLPDAYQTNVRLKLSLRELAGLEEAAAAQNRSAEQLAADLLDQAVAKAIK